ncbi:hypothetical protein [Adlercreutzia sp. ZJ305]|nr:hypothetical protein [Adlercreutzia sp. ZJ305]
MERKMKGGRILTDEDFDRGREVLSTDNAPFSSIVRKNWMENARYRCSGPRKPPTTALSHPLFPGNRR